MAITKEQALKTLTFHEVVMQDKQLKCRKWRRSGMPKTWKHNPERFSILVAHGLYEYGQVTDAETVKESPVYVPEECPVCNTKPVAKTYKGN